MKIKVKNSSRIGVISLTGDFLSEVEQRELREKVHELVDHGKKNIIINLTRLKHINSCGLGSLVCAYTTMRKVGGEMRLAGVGKTVKELLEITKLTQILPLSANVKEAIAAYRA
ncbi:MAG: STAS domain-containing protein [Ignavibacteriales bacterium]|nr:STAS domain-containing protein [Ignavibacteriales bacterium]